MQHDSSELEQFSEEKLAQVKTDLEGWPARFLQSFSEQHARSPSTLDAAPAVGKLQHAWTELAVRQMQTTDKKDGKYLTMDQVREAESRARAFGQGTDYAVICLQDAARQMIVKNRVKHQAAKRLQNATRRSVARHRAVLKIQCCARQRIARRIRHTRSTACSAHGEFAKVNQATIAIQTAMRRSLARRRFQERYWEYAYALLDEDAAETVQRRFRTLRMVRFAVQEANDRRREKQVRMSCAWHVHGVWHVAYAFIIMPRGAWRGSQALALEATRQRLSEAATVVQSHLRSKALKQQVKAKAKTERSKVKAVKALLRHARNPSGISPAMQRQFKKASRSQVGEKDLPSSRTNAKPRSSSRTNATPPPSSRKHLTPPTTPPPSRMKATTPPSSRKHSTPPTPPPSRMNATTPPSSRNNSGPPVATGM